MGIKEPLRGTNEAGGAKHKVSKARPFCQKKLMIWLLIGSALLLLIFCKLKSDTNGSKAVTFHYILEHHLELEEFVKDLPRSHDTTVQTAYGEWDVVYWQSSGMVEFYGPSQGVAPASEYTGFYYAPNDGPLGFQGVSADFIEEGSGWKWQIPNSDNWEYTEKVMDHWYWFEMHF